MHLKEGDLDLAFAERLKGSPDFCHWFLSRTGFAAVRPQPRLLHEEQAAARQASHWWKHWWCQLADGTQSETDIFVAFEVSEPRHRFALHIENKPPGSAFTPDQEKNYARRARFMMNKPRFLDYSAFETVLLAPESFGARNFDRCSAFDCYISYEELSKQIPEFAEALQTRSPTAGQRSTPTNLPVLPTLSVVAQRDAGRDGSPCYRWTVSPMGPDAAGRRKLGYRASGTIRPDLTGLTFDSGPEVHDENIDRWTPMNPTDRPDIRRKLGQLATEAGRRLNKSGDDRFSHVIE